MVSRHCDFWHLLGMSFIPHCVPRIFGWVYSIVYLSFSGYVVSPLPSWKRGKARPDYTYEPSSWRTPSRSTSRTPMGDPLGAMLYIFEDIRTSIWTTWHVDMRGLGNPVTAIEWDKRKKTPLVLFGVDPTLAPIVFRKYCPSVPSLLLFTKRSIHLDCKYSIA